MGVRVPRVMVVLAGVLVVLILAGCRPAADGASATGSSGAAARGGNTERADQRSGAPRGGSSRETPGARAESATATPTATPTRTRPSSRPAPICPAGPNHREVEEALAALGGYGPIKLDGVATPAECDAVRAFQRRFGLRPTDGRAGPSTATLAQRILVSTSAAERAKCGAGRELSVCIDLTQQTLWVVRGGTVVLGPTVVRTGMAGYATPTGVFTITQRSEREWSDPYRVWMPYWQRFNGGIGLHETVSYLHDGNSGSHGCVNLLGADARALWRMAGTGTTVRVFGRRPGT